MSSPASKAPFDAKSRTKNFVERSCLDELLHLRTESFLQTIASKENEADSPLESLDLSVLRPLKNTHLDSKVNMNTKAGLIKKTYFNQPRLCKESRTFAAAGVWGGGEPGEQELRKSLRAERI